MVAGEQGDLYQSFFSTSLPILQPAETTLPCKGKIRPRLQSWVAWAKRSPGSVSDALQWSARALQRTRRKKETSYLPGLRTAWHDRD